jgi:hypothetical protein
MKKILISFGLLLSLNVAAQLAPPPQKFNLHLSSNNILDRSTTVRTGPIMILGGASFIVAGALTTPVYVGGSTTQKKPFFQQGPRMLGIISGVIVSTVGVGVSLGGY